MMNKNIKVPASLQEYVDQIKSRDDGFENVFKFIIYKWIKLNQNNGVMENNDQVLKDKSYKKFGKELQKVIEASDIIVEVIDARDPLGTRSPQVY